MSGRAIIKGGFAALVAVLFALAAATVLIDAMTRADATPNGMQTYLLDATGGALLAFIAAQLGIAVGKNDNGTRFRVRMRTAMDGSADGNADWLLILDVVVFVLFGLWFLLLAVKPDLIKVGTGKPDLKDAPEFIQLHAKAFVGLALGALAALGSSA